MMEAPLSPAAQRVFAAVGDLGIRFGREWSVRIDAQAVSTDRFLLGLRKARIAGDPATRLLQTCASLGMPAAALAQYRSELPAAQYVHFGYECSGGVPWIKAYLEFFDQVDARLRSAEPRQVRYLVHRGFKWVPESEQPARVTSYWWYPHLSSLELHARLEEVLSNDRDGRLRAVAAGLIAKALQRTNPRNLHFLEVVESNNARRSFDLNFYRAQLRMADVRAEFEAVCEVFQQSPECAEEYWTAIATERFGHLAGGIDRSGRGFMTFYFGMAYFEPLGVAAC